MKNLSYLRHVTKWKSTIKKILEKTETHREAIDDKPKVSKTTESEVLSYFDSFNRNNENNFVKK